jgi:phage repressor protein C with HTH and peptisase S24 domain
MMKMTDRLKKIRTSLGLTQTEFAERVGKKMRTIQDYEAGMSKIDATLAKLLVYEFGVNLDWLKTGVGGMFIHDDIKAGEVSVPIYDVYVSAGYGAWMNGEAIIGYYKVTEDMIRREWKANPKYTIMAHVKGDSMQPLLKNGDIVVIDKSKTEIRKGLYVCRAENELFVKNVTFLKDTVVLTSENTAYEPIIVKYESFELIGQVVWYGRCI